MAILTITPTSASFSESPVILEVQTRDTDPLYNSSSLQHVLQLYVWDGNKDDRPSTPSFTLRNFPSPYEGISYDYKSSTFDLSSILSSYTTSSQYELYSALTPGSNVKWYTYNAYDEAVSGSTTLTGSNANEFTNPRIVLEGYNLWGEKQTLSDESIYEYTPGFPFLTGTPVTASLTTPVITSTIYRTDLPFYFSLYMRHDGDTYGGFSSSVDDVLVLNSLGGGYIQNIALSGDTQTTSSLMINNNYVPATYVNNFYLSGSEYFTITPRDSSNTYQSPWAVHLVQYECKKKYTPVRIAFKNRYGTLDQFDFNLVSRTSFNVDTKTYKQDALTRRGLSYDVGKGDTAYYTDGVQTILVNTDYISEDFNEFFKQMMVSDEIYLVNPATEDVYYGQYLDASFTRLTLESKSLQLKTSEVDKLIQYTFTFKYGTPYKLTL